MIHSAKIFVSILLLSLTSCATNQTQKTADEAALKNWQQITDDEKAYYVKKTGAAEPQWGLALSGGGQRSASTSIGFLEALHKADILSQLDVISTVSGGSYAAYWWFTKQHIGRKVEAGLFENSSSKNLLFNRNYTCNQCKALMKANISSSKCYYQDINSCNQGDYVSDTYKVEKFKLARYNNHRFYFNSSNHSNLMTFSQEIKHWQKAELAGKAVGWIPTIPLHWIANGLFDMRLNLNLFQNYYQNGLERDYGFYPKEITDFSNPNNQPLKYYENTTSRFSLNDEVSPPELFENTINPNNLPYWVINTTSEYSHTKAPKILRNLYKNAYSERLYDNVYEFTPLMQGSPRFGYYPIQTDQDNPFYIKLSRQIAISGAAIDDLPRFFNIAVDVINLSLGQYINNPAVTDRSGPNARRLMPFPFYWINQYQHDEASPFIYLSDGGHSDNLGAYSLIRRGVKNIILLDAEHEPSVKGDTIAKFVALQKLADRLDDEQTLSICYRGKKLGEKYCKAQEAVDIDFKNATSSVFTLHVTKSNNCDVPPEQDEQKVSTIYYTKLSIDYESTEIKPNELASVCAEQGDSPMDETPIASQKHRYSCTTRYYATQDGAKSREFPHDSTKDIFYSASQFAAYTALGYDLGRELVRKMYPKDLNYFEAKQ